MKTNENEGGEAKVDKEPTEERLLAAGPPRAGGSRCPSGAAARVQWPPTAPWKVSERRAPGPTKCSPGPRMPKSARRESSSGGFRCVST
eukprot:3032666-Heterocapsa_arctica.AAC.1